ncbi:MAG: CsgG/HfaB family protein [Myxococcota bacterium]
MTSVVLPAIAAGVFASACATESSQAVRPQNVVASANTAYSGQRHTLVVGAFKNASPYLRGVFSDGQDRLGAQARTLLKKDLVQSGRFMVVDRDSMADADLEAKIAGAERTLAAAGVVVTGEVTAFGRKQTGDKQLFGILGRGKEQTAYSKVTLNVVDVKTGAIIYSVEGAGEYALSNREVLGFGGTAAYDSTLNGKVLSLSVTEAVNRLVEGIEQGAWSPTL